MPTAAQTVLLVGGGHAMMPSIRHLRERVPASVQVTLVSDHPYLYYSGMVPEYLGGVYHEQEVRIDLRSLCDRYGIAWEQGRVVGLDPVRKEVVLADGQVLGADILAFDVGSVTPGPESYGPDIVTKPLHNIRSLAQRVAHMVHWGEAGNLAVVGGGAAGVETALNIAHRLRRLGLGSSIPLHLYEAGERVLPSFPKGMSADALRLLVSAGVRVMPNSQPESLENGVLRTPVDEIEYKAVLWATGTEGPPWFREAGLLTDWRGFVHCDPQLRMLGHGDLFVAGDSALVQGFEQLARIGVHAVKQGPVLLQNLADRVNGKPLSGKFRPYPVAPVILSTGQRDAWWVAGRVWSRNRFALATKHYIDRKWINPWLDPAYRRQTLWDYANAGESA